MWSREAASAVFDAANIAFVLSLVIGVVAVVLIVWTGNAKDEYLKRDLSSSITRGAQAQQLAAEANARAAELERDAAQLRLDLEKERQSKAFQ
jgi:hypothetical protein